MRELSVIGVGPGAAEQLTPAAREAMDTADRVFAAERYRSLAGTKHPALTLGDFETAFERMEAEDGSVAVLVSGDPGLYSLLPLLKRRFPDTRLRVFPGVSSLQTLCAAVGEVWQDAVILSGHGRPLSAAKFLNTVERHRLTILFCGGICTPLWACEAMTNAVGDLGRRVEAVIGERLSYPDEKLSAGSPMELFRAGRTFDALSLMLVRNPEPWTPPLGRPQDRDFEREAGIPMTAGEVRSVLLDRLNLRPGSVFWDLGAGTGSVSVAAALALASDGEVHAVERSPKALALLERNRAKFRLHNLTVHPGRALSVMGNLPAPTHVFIGGSGGELKGIVEALARRGRAVRVALSAVTLDTLGEAVGLLRSSEWTDLEAVQISVSASRPLGRDGRKLLMEARNPVTLLFANSVKKSEGMGE